jgi:hypothetical protein
MGCHYLPWCVTIGLDEGWRRPDFRLGWRVMPTWFQACYEEGWYRPDFIVDVFGWLMPWCRAVVITELRSEDLWVHVWTVLELYQMKWGVRLHLNLYGWGAWMWGVRWCSYGEVGSVQAVGDQTPGTSSNSSTVWTDENMSTILVCQNDHNPQGRMQNITFAGGQKFNFYRNRLPIKYGT